MKKPEKTFEDDILLLHAKATESAISVEEMLNILSGKGRPILLIILCLPFCQPIQIPGLSTPFGLVIAVIGILLAFGKRLWVPKSILAKKISQETLKKLTDKVLVLVRKTKRWTSPRMVWVCRHPVMQVVNGAIIFILGIFLALPLPIPFSNLVAAWAIFLIALGLLEDDGLFVSIGYVVFVLATLFLIVTSIALKHVLLNI